MPQETMRLNVGELDVPLAVIHELVKHHLLASLTLNGNGHARLPDPSPHPEKEVSAPVVPAATGAP